MILTAKVFGLEIAVLKGRIGFEQFSVRNYERMRHLILLAMLAMIFLCFIQLSNRILIEGLFSFASKLKSGSNCLRVVSSSKTTNRSSLELNASKNECFIAFFRLLSETVCLGGRAGKSISRSSPICLTERIPLFRV